MGRPLVIRTFNDGRAMARPYANMSIVLEDLIRRSEGLVKRAKDLRSYL